VNRPRATYVISSVTNADFLQLAHGQEGSVTARGELIGGRYGLLARVGDGGLGPVWRARDELLDRIVAVQQLPRDKPDVAGDRENRVAAQPRHPNAVMVHDAVEQSGRYYVVMEHFPGRSLAELVEDTGPLTEEAVARIGAQIAGALAAAHGEGIAHRDIKPANILVGTDGTAKITGFGLAPATGDDDGFAADVFALGETLHTVLDSGLGRRPKPATKSRPGRSLVDVLLWMQRRDPGERPSMPAAHDALTAVVDSLPAEAPPQPEPRTAPRTPARRPRWILRGAVAAAILLVAAVVATTLILDRGGSPASPRAAGQPVTDSDTGTGTRAAEPPPPGGTGSLVPPAAVTTTTSMAATDPAMHGAMMPETPAPACVARYQVTNSWQGGYLAEITVVNKAATISGWTIRWALPAGHTITNLWDGHLTRKASAITVTNLSYNGRLATNGTTLFGYTADAPGSARQLAATSVALTCESRSSS
jgi:hypothetical protein